VELRRWIVVGVVGAFVAVTCTRTFLAFYLLIPLGILGAFAAVRALTRLIRAFDKKAPADVREAGRSLARTAAWSAMIGGVVWGHDVQAARMRAAAETFAMALEERKVEDAYPESASDAPIGCSYIRAQKQRFTLVCSMTPPFEKATFSSSTKRWE
jgi:hypothetical protein